MSQIKRCHFPLYDNFGKYAAILYFFTVAFSNELRKGGIKITNLKFDVAHTMQNLNVKLHLHTALIIYASLTLCI